MRKLLVLGALVCVFGGSLIPGVSRAAIDKAHSTIYFDANNNIIGQKILYCNQVHVHSGNTDGTNPYRLDEEWGCGNPTVACQISSVNGEPVESCFPSGYDYGHSVIYFNAANGYTYWQYCDSSMGYAPFLGRPDCNMPAPAQVPQLTPFQDGW